MTWTCPNCGRRIGREPLVGVTTALVALGIAEAVGYGWLLLPYLGFLTLSMALVVSDLEDFRIPDRLNIPGSAVVGVLLVAVALVVGESGAALRGVAGAAAYFLGALAVYIASRGRGFGGGDVKLAPQLGLFAGFISWGTLGWAVFSTALIGGILALIMVVFGSAKKDTELPYGPAMVLGVWLSITLAGVGAFPLPT